MNTQQLDNELRPDVKFRFTLRSVFALTACVAFFTALVAYEVNGFLIFWLAWCIPWLLGSLPGSQWRFVWWSWAAAFSLVAHVLVEIASGYTTTLAFGYSFPRLAPVVLTTVQWFAVGLTLLGVWFSYKSWKLNHLLAKCSAVLSFATNVFFAGVLVWENL